MASEVICGEVVLGAMRMITSRALFSACPWSCRYSQPAHCFSFSPMHYCSLSCFMSVDEFASNLRVRFSYLVFGMAGVVLGKVFLLVLRHVIHDAILCFRFVFSPPSVHLSLFL